MMLFRRKKRTRTGERKVIIQLSTDVKGKPQFAKMNVIRDVKGKTILKEIETNVKQESTIKTDGIVHLSICRQKVMIIKL